MHVWILVVLIASAGVTDKHEVPIHYRSQEECVAAGTHMLTKVHPEVDRVSSYTCTQVADDKLGS